MRLLLAANNEATRRKEIIKSYLQTGFKQQSICIPLAATRNQIIYKTASSGPENLLKTGFAQKGLPSCPCGRHKPQSFIETKTVALLQPWYNKLQKINPNMIQNGPSGGPIWDRMHRLVKRSHFWDRQKWDRKIAKSTAKADPCNEQKKTTAFS